MDDNFLTTLMNTQNFLNVNNKASSELTSISTSEISQSLNDDEDEEVFRKRLEKHKSNLELRLQSLQVTVSMLRQQLAEEKNLWKKEIEESMQMPVEYGNGNHELEEVYDNTRECELYDEPNGYCYELNNLEYEERVGKYQQVLLTTQAEKRANLRRQMSINNYKRRLLEVENMCNLELLRVKQSVQFLQPLQIMASEWNTKSSGDTLIEEEGSSNHMIADDSNKREYPEYKKLEDLVPVESLSNKFCNEMNTVFAKMQYCNLKASSSIWPAEDEIINVAPAKSAVWFPQNYISSPMNSRTNLLK